MECEFTVELGADDPTLAVPWRSPDRTVEYVDLRIFPEDIDLIGEIKRFPELRDFLLAMNSGSYATAKCDVWFDALMDVDDEPYGAKVKCASYVDIFFVAPPLQFGGFDAHEPVVRKIVQQIRGSEELRARAEIVVRRVYYGETAQEAGLYWTLYLRAYGENQGSAREVWGRAMKLVAATLGTSRDQ